MIPAFPPSAFEMKPFEVEGVAFKNSFRGSKVLLHQKGENSLSNLSHNVTKSFSANESFITFSFILEGQLR